MGKLPSVFLSYARGDNEQFVGRLRSGLDKEGASVWFDRISLPSRALTFVQEIRDAIESHDRLIVVIDPEALTSAYVEAEWRYALEAAKVVIPVVRSLPARGRIRDAVPRELNRLHIVDARECPEEDVVAAVVRHLHEPEPLIGPPLHVPPPPPHYQPRGLDSARLESALQLDSPQSLTADTRERTLILHGMGGVGKSVAAAAVGRNIHVRRQFSSGVVWLELGRDPDVLAGLRRLGAAVADDLRHYTSVQATIPRLAEGIGGAPLLIVADNVWDDDDVAPFVAVMGSATRLLITTRDAGMPTRLGAVGIAIDPLSHAEALHHLADWVHADVDQLPQYARTVAEDCGGLPLALALVGAMARDGTPWLDISAAIDEADLGFIAKHLPDYPFPDLLRALRVSVVALENSSNDVERVAATCFRQLAALRWDRPVPEATLVTLWSARTQLTERRARLVLSVLVSKALLSMEGEAPSRAVSLHDLLHDLARGLALEQVPDLAIEHGALLDAFKAKYPNAPFISDDGYFLDHFVHHLYAAGRATDLPSILREETEDGSNAWWSVRLQHGQVSGYEADLRRAWGDASEAGDIAGLVRWALMIASVRSAIGEVPPGLVALLLEHHLWTPAQALAAADWAAGRGPRLDLLVAALPFLPVDQTMGVAEEAAILARQEREDADRSRRLLDVASALDGPARQRFVYEALPLHEPPSRFVDAWTLSRVWQLDPERTDAVDATLAWIDDRLDTSSSVMALEHVIASAPPPQLPRLRRMAAGIREPADRLRILLALLERGYGPLDDLVHEAEDELTRVGAVAKAPLLDARLTPFRPAAEREISVRRIVANHGTQPPRDRLGPLLAALPYAAGEDRDSAKREVFEILEHAGPSEAEAVTAGARVRQLRQADPELWTAFINTALVSATAIDDRWRRISMLVRLLPETDKDRARALVEDEARRILTIDDAGSRALCLAAYAGRLGEGAAERVVGEALQRMIGRLTAGDLAMHSPPLLTHARERDIAALQAAVGKEIRFPLSLRPALFGAWAKHGNWDAAMDALDGGSAFEVERAVDPLVDHIPEAVAEILLGTAIDMRDAEHYAAVVPLIPRAPDDTHPYLLEVGFQAVETLENPYRRLHLIERLAPLLPVQDLTRLAALMPEGAGETYRDQARLAIVRAYVACGDRLAAADFINRMEIADNAAQAAVALAEVSPPQERAGWLNAVEQKARGLFRTSKTELLVAVARHSDEPKRTRLLREATRAAEEPLEQDSMIPWARADALRTVAEAQEGTERQRLLLEAWDSAPREGAFSGVRTLEDLAPLLAEAAPGMVQPRWERSLEVAVSSRRAALEELTALADVVVALGGQDTATEVSSALEDVDRWWP